MVYQVEVRRIPLLDIEIQGEQSSLQLTSSQDEGFSPEAILPHVLLLMQPEPITLFKNYLIIPYTALFHLDGSLRN